MRFAARLKRPEQPGGAGGCGPRCPPIRCVYENDWSGQATEPPAPSPRCGRTPTIVPVVFDSNFYGNADRLGGGYTDLGSRAQGLQG